MQLREFLAVEVAPIADDCWTRAAFPMQLIPSLGKLGVLGSALPETRLFPSGAVFRGWCAMELARIDTSLSGFVAIQGGLVVGTVGLGGSAEQKERWLPALARGETVGAFALTEPLSGSDVARGLRTSATRQGDHWVLDGSKRWIGNGTIADLVVVFARDTGDGQVKGFLVPAASDGFTARRIDGKIGLRTIQNADIELRGVRIDESLRLPGIASFRDVARVLGLTRAEVAWQAVGTSIGAYEAALGYARSREQFGRPIAGHQLVQDLLVRCLGNITASIALCVQVSRMLDDGRQSDAHSSLAKSFTTSRMRETVAWAREILGGNGIVPGYGVARAFADAEAVYSYEGTAQMNSLIVGRAITGHAAFA
jgi:glutaryl-CoA dehydrogenase